MSAFMAHRPRLLARSEGKKCRNLHGRVNTRLAGISGSGSDGSSWPIVLGRRAEAA
jgi:hypothetical protein